MMIGHSCHGEEASLRVGRRRGGRMARWLKRGRDAGAVAEDDAKISAAVEMMLVDIQARGDKAVRELSIRFDKWDRADYRLTDAEIRGLPGRALGPRHRGHQVRAGAGQEFRRAPARRDAGCRGRDAAGRGARPQAHPGPEQSAATSRAASTRSWPRRTCRSSPRRSRACRASSPRRRPIKAARRRRSSPRSTSPAPT